MGFGEFLIPLAMSLALLAFSGMLIGVLIWVVRRAMRRAADARRLEETSAEAFERSVMQELGQAAARDAPYRMASPKPATGPAATPEGPGTPLQATTEAPPGFQQVLRRLEGLGQVGGVDGMAALADGRTQGAVFHLRDGRRCLIVPQPEPPEAMEKYLRGYQFVFTLHPGGEIAVSQRMSDFVSGLIDTRSF